MPNFVFFDFETSQGMSKKIPINNDKKTADLIANKKKIK